MNMSPKLIRIHIWFKDLAIFIKYLYRSQSHFHMSRLLIATLFLLFSQIITAQICGTPQEPLLERIDVNKKLMMIHQRGAVKYIPVTFHLVANSDSVGAIQVENVLAQLCSIN